MSGLRDKVKGLTSEESSDVDENDKGEKMSDLEGFKEVMRKLEEILFDFSTFSDRLKEEMSEFAEQRKKIKSQRVDVGKTLTALNKEVGGFKGTVTQCLTKALEPAVKEVSTQLGHTVSRRSEDLNGAAQAAANAAQQMAVARNRVGLKTLALNLVAYPLFAILLLSLLCGVFPWELADVPRREEMARYGRGYVAVYPYLSKSTKRELVETFESLQEGSDENGVPTDPPRQ